MATHLLIPINPSVNIDDIDFHLSQIEDEEHGQRGHAITVIRDMLQKAKQISLSEDDINQKADAFLEIMFPLNEYAELETEREQNQFAVGRTGCQIAYKNALNSLLK